MVKAIESALSQLENWAKLQLQERRQKFVQELELLIGGENIDEMNNNNKLDLMKQLYHSSGI